MCETSDRHGKPQTLVFRMVHGAADFGSSTRPALQRAGWRERGAVIAVRFLDGGEGLKTHLRDPTWQGVSPRPANLQFAFVDRTHAERAH
ncbi:MAG: hypothetical protein WBW33_07270 [Bryobacteraceae bacterium]